MVENCSEAIKLNNKYTKALSRRATAAEQLGNLTMALEGKTVLSNMSPGIFLAILGRGPGAFQIGKIRALNP